MVKCVSELYNLHPGEDIYVIGTGASLRTFPLSLLHNKITIGLNMTWKTIATRYSITIHPDLSVPEFLPGEQPHPEITWITKHSKAKALISPEQLQHAEENFYFFEMDGRLNTQPPDKPTDAGRILDWVRQPTENKLYLWTSIAQAGVNLAANMGAKNIILIGCDNCALLGKQHTRWRSATPDTRYREYYEGLAEMRPVLRDRGVNLVSMTPFLSLESPEQDFERLCQELDQPAFIASGADISPKLNLRKYYVNQLKRQLKQVAKKVTPTGWRSLS
jgi:hypothetical protein